MIGGIGDDYGGGCGGVDDDDYGGDFCGGSGQDVHLVPLSSSSTFWRSCQMMTMMEQQCGNSNVNNQ